MSDRFDQGHALVIGVGADLPSTAKDAQGLARLLQDPERCAYPAHQVHLLTSEQATREQILTALKTLAQATTTESTVVVYFSGHGLQITQPFKLYYLMPFGYDQKDLSETAISSSEFLAALQAIPAQKLLVLLDCCHAGGITDLAGMKIAKAPLPPEATQRFASGGGRMMIGSSQPQELSYAGESYSAFTHALMKGLCGAAAVKQDGYIRATDLAMYASRLVPRLTQDQQHPVLEIEQADNFVLAYYAAGSLQPKGLPPELEEQPRIEAKPGLLNGYSQHVEASGDRAVAIGGDAQGATIVTGNSNVVEQGNLVQKGKYNLNAGMAHNFTLGDTIHRDQA